MFTKNYLTRNLKSLLIEAAVVSVLPGIRADAMSPVHYCTWEKSSFIPERGSFCVSNKSNQKYVQLTTTNSRQQKTSLGKLVNNRLKKYINYILSQFKRLVKGKIADMYFKPKSPVFSK